MSARLSFRSTVYGAADADLDDPAERYHEASKLYPSLAEQQLLGIARLEASPELQRATAHPVRQNLQLPLVPLPSPHRPPASLWRAIRRRRSRRDFDGSTLRTEALAALVLAGYGRRAVPSAGGLYPLELYVLPARVDAVEPGVYWFDAERRGLERQRCCDVDSELHGACLPPGVADGAAAALFLAAAFWRTRFKYGLRGYRFALLEAGHAAQNVALAAAALGVRALPLGGFYDAAIESLLGLDGVDESVLYGVLLGGDAA